MLWVLFIICDGFHHAANFLWLCSILYLFILTVSVKLSMIIKSRLLWLQLAYERKYCMQNTGTDAVCVDAISRKIEFSNEIIYQTYFSVPRPSLRHHQWVCDRHLRGEALWWGDSSLVWRGGSPGLGCLGWLRIPAAAGWNTLAVLLSGVDTLLR